MGRKSVIKHSRRISVVMRMLLITLTTFVVFIVSLSLPITSVEGIWRSPSFIGCMCDAYSFWKLEAGVITTYSDRHNSGYVVGSYAQQEDGRFTIKVHCEVPPDYEMVVTPHAFHWEAPEDIFQGKPSPWLARVFYRPLFQGRADQVIADTLAAGPDAGPEPFP